MREEFRNILLQSTGAAGYAEVEMIQSLWSGYGSIVRYELNGCDTETVVVKHVKFPKGTKHPRGWNTNLSHLRKLKSYQVETAWYKQWAIKCDDKCRVPKCYAVEAIDDEVFMVFEDLDGAGFSVRKTSVTMDDIESCLHWLANFHATFINESPIGLWNTGTYWHLETRPEELEVLSDKELKRCAKQIDEILENTPYKTFVHGDAKLANFCFPDKGEYVAAVDFQYVGGGCGMKDVAYFIGSCIYDEDCEEYESQLLNYYFSALRIAIKEKNKAVETEKLEQNWRELYPVAWTDFHRFIKGWSPGHWKINSYSERLRREVLAIVKNAEMQT